MSAAIVARERKISSQKPLTEKRCAMSMAKPSWSEPTTCPTAAMWNSGIGDHRTSPAWRSRFSCIWRAMFATKPWLSHARLGWSGRAGRIDEMAGGVRVEVRSRRQRRALGDGGVEVDDLGGPGGHGARTARRPRGATDKTAPSPAPTRALSMTGTNSSSRIMATGSESSTW